MTRKLLLLLLVTIGFATSLLFLQDRLTKEEYLTPVEIVLKSIAPLSQTPQFLRIIPGGELDDAKESFKRDSADYSFKFSRIAQSVAFRLFDQNDGGKIQTIMVKVGTNVHEYSGQDIAKNWEWKPEDKGGLWILKERIVDVPSVLRFLGDRYRVMNWPGDLTILMRFLADQSRILVIHATLFLICILLIFFEDSIIRYLSRKDRFSSLEKGWGLFATFLVATLLVRHVTLGLISSGDQATYLTIGQAMNHGVQLYRDAWDTKSPGFFLYYSLVLRLGDNLIISNVVGALLIAATGLALANIARKLGSSAVLTGLTYVLISSVFETNFAVTPEQLVVFCSSIALLFILRGTLPALLGAGVFLGSALVCKYPAGLEFVGLGSWWLFLSVRRKVPVARIVAGGLVAMAGALVPIGATVLWFSASGTLGNLWTDNILFDLFKYAGKNSLSSVFQSASFFIKTYFVFVLLAIIGFVVAFGRRKDSDLSSLLFFWTPTSLIAVLMPAQGEAQYWFQFWGVMALCIPLGLGWWNRRSTCGSVVPVLLMVVFLVASARIQYDKPDLPAEVSKFLAGKLKSADQFFVLGGSAQAAYFLTDRTPPSKYVHGYGRPDSEMKRILEAKPRFIVEGTDYEFKAKWRTELANYKLVQRVGYYEIYEWSVKTDQADASS